MSTHWTNFIPLIVFAWFSRLCGLSPEMSWMYSFYAGAALAIAQLAYAFYRKIEFDYIAIATDAFLIYGAAGFLAFPFLLAPYAYFKQSVIFLWVIIIGFITALTRPEGFLQVSSHHYFTAKSRYGSTILLTLSLICFVVSFILTKYFQLSTTIAVILPFICLLIARNTVRNRI